jgi:hypothetical protein
MDWCWAVSMGSSRGRRTHVSFEPSELPTASILSQKHHDHPSIFTPQNLLREARRQKGVDGFLMAKTVEEHA